jgi:hypothetical protein
MMTQCHTVGKRRLHRKFRRFSWHDKTGTRTSARLGAKLGRLLKQDRVMWALSYSRSLLAGPWKSSFTMATLAERECWPQQPTPNQKQLLLAAEQNVINILIPPERQVRPKIMLCGYTSSTTNCISANFFFNGFSSF